MSGDSFHQRDTLQLCCILRTMICSFPYKIDELRLSITIVKSHAKVHTILYVSSFSGMWALRFSWFDSLNRGLLWVIHSSHDRCVYQSVTCRHKQIQKELSLISAGSLWAKDYWEVAIGSTITFNLFSELVKWCKEQMTHWRSRGHAVVSQYSKRWGFLTP